MRGLATNVILNSFSILTFMSRPRALHERAFKRSIRNLPVFKLYITRFKIKINFECYVWRTNFFFIFFYFFLQIIISSVMFWARFVLFCLFFWPSLFKNIDGQKKSSAKHNTARNIDGKKITFCQNPRWPPRKN